MLLYTYDPAPNPRRVRLFLDYKGIGLPTRQVDLRKLEQLEPAFRAINPRCIVPALQLDDGSVLCDGLAICLYLESLYPERPLFGADALERARIVSWDQYLFTDGFQPCAEVWRNGHPAFAEHPLPGPHKFAQIPALVERGRERLAVFFAALETAVAGRRYLVGEALSWADICLLVTLEFAGRVRCPVPAGCPQLLAWQQRIAAELAPYGAA